MIKKHKKLTFIIGTLLVFFVFSIFFINNYTSRIILSRPFSVAIEGLTSDKANSIKIYGYSLFGNIQSLNKINNKNEWEFSTYSNFESLFIYTPDSIGNIKQISIITGNEKIEIKDLKNKFLNGRIDLTTYIKGKLSKIDIFQFVFYWKGFKYLMISIFAAIIYFVSLILFFKKNKSIKYPFKIFWSIFVAGLIIHILFFVYSNLYLISSGIFFLVLISLFVYFTFITLERIAKLKLKIKEIRLAIISITLCLVIIESLFILTGFKSTYAEKREVYYYTSKYNSGNDNWFHLWGLNHYLKTSEYSYCRIVNSDGLSDKEHEVIKKANEYRIIGLGDSFTEGDGADADSTWLKFLERDLRRYPLKKSIIYFNAGVCGSDPYFEYKLLKERLLKYKPDLVFIAINNSDIDDIAVRGGVERFKANGSVKFNSAPCWEPLYAVSHISRLIFDALGYSKQLFEFSDKQILDSKNKIIEVISEFKELSVQKNFKFVVIFHPTKKEIDDNKMSLENVMDTVEGIYNVEVLDMLKYFKNKEKINQENSSSYFWKQDGHHNAKGYKVFANGVEWKMKEMGIIDSLISK